MITMQATTRVSEEEWAANLTKINDRLDAAAEAMRKCKLWDDAQTFAQLRATLGAFYVMDGVTHLQFVGNLWCDFSREIDEARSRFAPVRNANVPELRGDYSWLLPSSDNMVSECNCLLRISYNLYRESQRAIEIRRLI